MISFILLFTKKKAFPTQKKIILFFFLIIYSLWGKRLSINLNPFFLGDSSQDNSFVRLFFFTLKVYLIYTHLIFLSRSLYGGKMDINSTYRHYHNIVISVFHAPHILLYKCCSHIFSQYCRCFCPHYRCMLAPWPLPNSCTINCCTVSFDRRWTPSSMWHRLAVCWIVSAMTLMSLTVNFRQQYERLHRVFSGYNFVTTICALLKVAGSDSVSSTYILHWWQKSWWHLLLETC